MATMIEIETETILRILLVDDDEDDYLITKDMLHTIPDFRFSLDWISSYDDALLAIDQKAHDVYLIDYRLGYKNGLNLIKDAVQRECKAPLILLTGLEDREVDYEAMNAGASDYLVKGQIDPQLLDRAIRYSIQHKRMLETLKENEKQKEMLFATLTHDLKTPIHAEHRVLQIFQKGEFGPLTNTQYDVLTELIKSNRFMYRMVDNLLATYKFEHLWFNLNKETGNLHQEITSLVNNELKMLAQEKNHTLDMALADNIPPLAFDPIEIRRVLQNLIHNAIMYTPPNGNITISTQFIDNTAWVYIRDTGVGIEHDKLNAIFKPYYSMAKKFRNIGTGLGLYLSKQIIDAHGGFIGVESTLGSGSCFYFSIPAAHDE